MGATDNLGSHLLGRQPSPPDPRDYKLAHFLTADPLNPFLAAVVAKHYSKQLKAWATAITLRVEAISPAPVPDPTPAPDGDVMWSDTDDVLDQGQTGHCVGFGGAQWGNTLPIDDHFVNADGDDLYYAAKKVDGEPRRENGSTVRSLAKVLKSDGRLSAYAFASSIDEIVAWLDDHGPVIMGTDWTEDMFNPDSTGLIVPTGAVAGGHCYVAVGHRKAAGRIRYLNSWSNGWGDGGYFEMTIADAASLFASQGEALAAVELSL